MSPQQWVHCTVSIIIFILLRNKIAKYITNVVKCLLKLIDQYYLKYFKQIAELRNDL